MNSAKQKVAFCLSGLPGSGSTTCSRNLARKLGLGKPYCSGGAARCLSQKREDIGQDTLLSMYRDEENGGLERLRIMIADMMVRGDIPARPNITAEYEAFPREFDLIIDMVQSELLERESSAIHEGRMVPHLAMQLEEAQRAPDKLFIKIFFVANEEERMKRLQQRDEHRGRPAAHIQKESEKRLAVERARYRILYGIEDHVDLCHFDIVLDTTRFTPEETVNELLRMIGELHPGLLLQFCLKK